MTGQRFDIDPKRLHEMADSYLKATHKEGVKPIPRNPMHRHALGLFDLKPESQILVVGINGYHSLNESTVEAVFIESDDTLCIRCEGGGKYLLTNIGVLPTGSDETGRYGWADYCVTFRNDSQTRRAVVEWLLSRTDVDPGTEETAKKIVKRHQEDYRTEVSIEDGKLVAHVIS